jgi:purine-cytosine permease-like protein
MNLIVLTMNTYSSSLGVLTIINSLRPTRPTSWVRIAVVIGVTIAWALLALAGGEDVVNAAWLALTIMLYVLVPWTAVNLVDFFFIRHGRYAVTELFKPRGIYGEWNWRGLLPYAAGLVAMAPFAVLPKFYTGPLAQRLGGIDIAWFIGLIVAAGLYQLVAPRAGIEAAAIAGSERELEPGANAC